jgi:hypothetical protein
MRLKRKKWKWRNKQINKPARLSDSRDFTDFTQFTASVKPSVPTVLLSERREKRGEFEGEKKKMKELKKKTQTGKIKVFQGWTSFKPCNNLLHSLCFNLIAFC